VSRVSFAAVRTGRVLGVALAVAAAVTRGSIEKAYHGDWVLVVQCTAADGDFSTCRHSIPTGTLIRTHVWAFKGSTTKYDGYSAQTPV
jgi:hypothetical protein